MEGKTTKDNQQWLYQHSQRFVTETNRLIWSIKYFQKFLPVWYLLSVTNFFVQYYLRKDKNILFSTRKIKLIHKMNLIIYLIVGVDVDRSNEGGVGDVRNEVEDLLEVIRDLRVHRKTPIHNL